MNFASKLKNLRKKTGFSQEKLAEKLGVSRQAVTKWETAHGIPDIDNIINIAKLFDVSIDDLVLDEDGKKEKDGYLFESFTEYDIDDVKHFEMNLGDARSLTISAYDGEKLSIKLASNTITEIESKFKVKIDDIKKRIDIGINSFGEITKAQMKNELDLFIKVPNSYTKSLEIGLQSQEIRLNSLQAETIELDLKVSTVSIKNTEANIEIDCNQDMNITCDSLHGQLAINQVSATSTLFIPEGLAFQTVKKGIGTKVYYQKDDVKVSDFSVSDSDNIIELNGIKSELIISRL